MASARDFSWTELPSLGGQAGGRLCLLPHWLATDQADALLQRLHEALPWTTHTVRIFGRELPSPRLSSWHGDPGTDYRYSGQRHPPQPWTPALSWVRQRLADDGLAFNAVLANAYRDGQDAMGWHADDEPELGPEPLIASVSLGAQRHFLLRPKQAGPARQGLRQRLELGHGSLLLMAGRTQHDWQHALPRSRRVNGLRINLTFRWVEAR